MAYTFWGSYQYNDTTGQFDLWVAAVPGATPPMLGESRDDYEARQLALQAALHPPKTSGTPKFLVSMGLVSGVLVLGMIKSSKRRVFLKK